MGNAIATTVTAELTTIKASVLKGIFAPYRESDNVKARKVVTLTPFIGAGHSAETIIRDTARAAAEHGIDIPSGFGKSSIGHALTVARAMHKLGQNVTITASARDAIAAAGVDIVRASKAVGGGVTGLTAALELATDGTDNGAEIAERMVATAITVNGSAAAARRAGAPKIERPGAQTPGGKITADTDDTAPEAEQTPATTPALASFSITRMLAEIDRRVVAGHVLTEGERTKFEQLASNVEEVATVDA